MNRHYLGFGGFLSSLNIFNLCRLQAEALSRHWKRKRWDGMMEVGEFLVFFHPRSHGVGREIDMWIL